MATMPGISTGNCVACGREFVRTPKQGMRKYCWECSEEKDLKRKKLVNHQAQSRALGIDIGAVVSANAGRRIGYEAPTPDLKWLARISVPFSYAASKNHIYALNRKGHVRLREESANLKATITAKLHVALLNKKVFHNKVWIDILVQKSNHRGDAINVIDLVCDGVKKAIPVDDRWFSIRFLDWEIVRKDGQIFIGVGQEHEYDAQVCSYCGQILPLDQFNRKANGHLGIGRECLTCRSAVRAERKRFKCIKEAVV